jgi:hypothetical protein
LKLNLECGKEFALREDELLFVVNCFNNSAEGFLDWCELKCSFMAAILLPLAKLNSEFIDGFKVDDVAVS